MTDALRQLKEKRISDRKVVESISRWKAYLAASTARHETGGLSSVPLSESAYSSYRRGQRRPDFDRAKLIYEFLESGFDPDIRIDTINRFGIDVSSAGGALAQKILGFIGTDDSHYRYKDIDSLCGTYSMYRRNWIRSSEDYILRSIFHIGKVGGVYQMSETQQYKFRNKTIDEHDQGYVFPYSTNFFALSNSSSCLKFYTFHEMYPPLRRGTLVEELMGTVTGMATTGPHPSFKFVCKRSADRPKTGVFNLNDMKSSSEFEDILTYLMT
ncbi:hypothetical protein [Roseibium sp. SCP14]|uniref:hypothetical protein n=1 Tax=Roseibium sp. SCP14 TaxID=3141375 RepID=UPI0033387DF2